MGIGTKIRAYLQSPQGRRIVERGQRELSKPENRQKLRNLTGRFNKRGRA